MSKVRLLSKFVRNVAGMVLPKKGRGRLVALVVAVSLATTATFSAASSAKLADNLFPASPLQLGATLASVITGRAASAPNYGPEVEEPPIIVTDKSSYEPGETVTFTGQNWTAGETVVILLRAGAAEGESVTLSVTANAHGSFVVSTVMPDGQQGESAPVAHVTAGEGDARPEAKGTAKTGAVTAAADAAPKSGAAAAAAASQPDPSHAGGTIYIAVATGATSGASAQTQFKENGRVEEEGEDDADIPRFMIGKVSKEEYLRRRQEHVDRLRGIERGRPFDPGARGRAIRQMEQQTGKPDKNTVTNEVWSSASSPTSGAEATGGISAFTSTMSASGLSNSSWQAIGPAPIPNGQTSGVTHPVSGRVTAIAIHPTNSNIVYVGAAQGGVYRTLDGGSTWTPIFDNAQSLAIGSIAVSPSHPSTIYVGTGEGNYSGDTYFGVGVYRVDQADSPSPVLTGPFNQEVGTGTDVLTGRSISKVIVHPTNPDIIFLAVNNAGIGGISGSAHPTQNSSRGVYRSTNAASSNATFQKLTTNTANAGNRSATDLEFEPGNPNVLLATIVGFSTAGDGGVYRSTNALAPNPTFTQTLSVGTTSATARAELAINKVGNAVTVYVASTDANGTVKRSTDGGVTWSAALSSATGFCGSQCFYDMPIAVDPNNANVVFIGGNAGESGAPAILKKSTNALSTATFVRAQTGLHADSQAIEFDLTNSNIVWTGNDGGVWKSTDAAASWISLNNTGFNATQFQSVAVHPTDKNFTIGGTQDNGTQRVRTDGTWTRTDYGDGGFALIDQSATGTTSVRQYHTYWNAVGQGNIVGFATTTSPTAFENWTFLGCGGTANGLTCNDSAVLFYAPMALGPGTPNTLYFGTDKIYRSTNSGSTMTAVSQTFVSGVAVSAIGISRQNDAVRIVGLENGKVFRTMTGATTLNDVTGTIPARYISRAVIDPNNTNVAYVTLSGFFGNSTPHIYKTTNLNAASPTWTGVGHNIPDIPVNAFVIDPADPNMLYAGTDIGVFRSADAGATWAPFSNGLARVAVFDMAIQNNHRILRAATHGRGMWEISLDTSEPAAMQGTVTDSSNNNPVGGATVTVGTKTATSNAAGAYQIADITAGTYSVTVTAPGYNTATENNVVLSSGETATRNFSLAPAPAAACLTDTTLADFQAGSGTNVNLTNSPGDVQLASNAAALDQQQTTLSVFVDSITTTAWQAQTFVPATSGKLTQADFQSALSSTGAAGTMIVELRNTTSGAPGSTVLATTNLTTVTGTGNGWHSVTFAAPASVNAGTTYALVLRASSGGPYRAVRSNNNSYANGAWYSSTNSGGAWAAQGQDLAFRTYVSAGFAASGDLVSSTKDANPAAGDQANWGNLSWTAAAPAGTTVRFQVAASNNAAGPFTYVGPNGTASTFFTTSGASLSQFNGFRYLRYRAHLSTTNSAVTPTLNDVTVCYQNGALPETGFATSPAMGTYGGATTLTATLTSNGAPVAGKLVTFTLNGANFAGNAATTNASGVATLSNASLAGINAGSYPAGVGVSFAGDSTHAGSQGSNSLTVGKAAPTVNWANPAGINYGTPLGASQLNATASVPGSFAYSPAAGAVLGAGEGQALRVEFTPADSANYNTASREVSINVSKAGLTVKADDKSRAYGATNPALTYAITGFVNGDTQATATTGEPSVSTNAVTASPAGAYPISAAAGTLASGNYAFTFAGGTLTVTKAGQTITFDSLGAKTYGDGDFALSAAASSGLPVGFAAGGNCTISGATLRVGGAGPCTVTATQPGDANYEAATPVERSFQINKAGTTTVVTIADAVYSGAPHGATAGVTGAGGFSQPLVVTYAGRNGTTYGPSADAPTNAGEYTASATYAGGDNHEGSGDSRDFVISKAAAAITLGNLSQTFDGSPKVAAATTSPAGLSGVSVTYEGSAAAPIAAGTYAVLATLSHENYSATEAAGTLTVGKAAPVVSASGNTCAFTGSACAGSGTATGVDGADLGTVTLSYTPGGSAPVGAGEYSVVASVGETANHTAGTSAPAAVKINKAAPSVGVNVPEAPVTFDGNSHPAAVAVYGVGGPSDLLSPAPVVTYNGGTDAPVGAGTYAVRVEFAGNDNYLPAVHEAASIVIGKATPVVTITGGLGVFTYDATPRAATATVTGVGGADLGAAVVTYNGGASAPAGAGSYAVVATYAGGANYGEASSEAGRIVINKAVPVVTITGGTFTYDGGAHPATGSVKGGGNTDLAGHIGYNTADGQAPVNAGSYVATISFAGDDNYEPATNTAAVVINKATAAITLGGLYHLFDGAAKSATAATSPAGLSGLSVTYNGSAAAPTAAGSYSVLASLTNDNYAAPNATGTMIVNTAPVARVRNVTVNSGADCSANGASVNDGSSDPDGNSITVSQSPAGPYQLGTTNVTLTVKDSHGATSTQAATVTVVNPNPVVAISGPAGATVYAKGTTVNFAGSYTDNPGSAYAATWSINNGTTTVNVPGVINAATGAVTAAHTFNTTGVYLVKLTVTDGCGGAGESAQIAGADLLVAIFDRAGGTVSTTTKAPTISSPAGAFVANPSLVGSATSGFNAAYSSTGAVPTGQATFNFVAANLNFASTSYQWMAVTRPNVWLRGAGTVNNQSGFEFLIAAVDGQLTGGGGADRFRIRIWRKSDGAVIYDNLMGGALNASAATATTNGDIAIK
ncbi:MAG TPA: MBG domain-containing protein [Pyrinomonadaceae bacterium]|nr:MBG domain-containing protein [Pyrinomonadaceae bacterium]